MSLIQEALRRQQEESGKVPSEAAPPPFQQPSGASPAEALEAKAPAATPPPTPKPPPAPPVPKLAEPKPTEPTQKTDTTETESTAKDVEEKPAGGKTNSRPWPTLAGIAALILILIGGGAWMLIYAFQQWSPPDNTEPAATEEITEQVTETIPEEEDTTTVNTDNTVPEIHDESQPATETEHPEPLVVKKPPVEWPIISISGLVGKGRNGAVIINGEVKSVGQNIEDATIILIEKQGAWLKYQGEKRFFRLEFGSQ